MNKLEPKTWVEYARKIPVDDVVKSYVNEIQDHFGDYNIHVEIMLEKTINEIIEIYRGEK